MHVQGCHFARSWPNKGDARRPTLEVLLLEGAEYLIADSEDGGESGESVNVKEVLIEVLLQEMQLWRCDRLPLLLLIPWQRAEPLALPVYSATLPVPLGWKQREAVLQVCLANAELSKDDPGLLPWLADITAGFLPSDLAALCSSAAIYAVASLTEDSGRPLLSRRHFHSARAVTNAATTRGTCAVKSSFPGMDVCSGLDAVVGQDVAVAVLRSMVVQPFRNMQREEMVCGVEPPIGVVVTGCPGSGKSFLAAQLASELSAHFFNASPADLLSSRVGDAEKQLESLFRSARGCAPSIILLEDIENLAPAAPVDREGASAETCISYVLRAEMDTVKIRRQQHRLLRAGQQYGPQASEALVLLVGTTNELHHLAPWLCAPHRFSLHVQLDASLTQKDHAREVSLPPSEHAHYTPPTKPFSTASSIPVLLRS